MITVYTDYAYLKLYNVFKEFNLFELAENAHRFAGKDADVKEDNIKLLTAWMNMFCKHFDKLQLRGDYKTWYNLSKESLSLYDWMNTCTKSVPASYCRTCNNFQIHYMKHNDTFMASSPRGMEQVGISTVLPQRVYTEYLEYRTFLRQLKRYNNRPDSLLYWDSHVAKALDEAELGVYNVDHIKLCINHVQFTCEQDLDISALDQDVNITEDDQEEDDE